jgi:uncharacterized protein HemX
LGHLIRNALGVIALWFVSLVPTGVRPQVNAQQYKQFQEYQRQQEQLDAITHSDWMISHYDLQQNQELNQIEEHFRRADGDIENLRNKHESLLGEVRESHGEQTVWFSIISAALLGVGALAVNNMMRLRKDGNKP